MNISNPVLQKAVAAFYGGGTFTFVAPYSHTYTFHACAGGGGGGPGRSSSSANTDGRRGGTGGTAGTEQYFDVNLIKGHTINITVGGGGVGGTYYKTGVYTPATNGENTIIGTLTTLIGGIAGGLGASKVLNTTSSGPGALGGGISGGRGGAIITSSGDGLPGGDPAGNSGGGGGGGSGALGDGSVAYSGGTGGSGGSGFCIIFY